MVTMEHTILDGYRTSGRARDEMIGDDGALRPHWRRYAEAVKHATADEFRHRHEQAAELLEENGVSYNVYGDAKDRSRPWSIDLVPQIVEETEFQRIERGLMQRARLLEAILRDLYGPQRLLHDRQIPPEFVYANPGFLRPCHGMHASSARLLHLYAADIARGDAGEWLVVSDRTQAPSGAGYALENRLVTTRLFPTLTSECRVQRLASFFERLRTTLRAIAPGGCDNPAIAVLSPGPSHETYFEHSYLARYLGFMLVEDDDLTVRDNCVFVKTIQGLARIDVLLRRIDDHLCDPLEFPSDSAKGLVGVAQAARAGNVALANGLGSGVLEAPALRAILPGLARHVLNEDLLLPTVRTWWCADESHLRYVEEHLNDLLIAPAFAGSGWNPIVAARLSSQDREALLAAIRANPHQYVAQDRVTPSTVPVWSGGSLTPRHMMMRCFAVASDDDGYAVMPGGLTRFSDAPESLVISMRRGGGSKDTWVMTSGPVDNHSLLPLSGRRVDIKRTAGNLPSRAADNLYWLGRYLERAEAAVRTIRCVVSRITDESGTASGRELPAVIRSLALVLPSAPNKSWYDTDTDAATVERAIMGALYDPAWAGSVRSVFDMLNRAAWVVRDRLSLDTWRVLMHIVEDLPESPEPDARLGDVFVQLNQLITGLAAFSGLATENMTRGQGWLFLDIGRRVERTLNTLELLRSALVIPIDPESAVLQAALEISDSSMTYRSRYGANLTVPAVLDLLITDDSNPRSVGFQVVRLARHIDGLPTEQSYPFASREMQFVTRLSAELRLVDIFELAAAGPPGRRSVLESRLLEWAQTLRDISDALAWHYISHIEFSRTVPTLSKGNLR